MIVLLTENPNFINMKKLFLLSLIMLIGLNLLAQSSQLLAYYPLTADLIDNTALNADMDQKNVSFKNAALYFDDAFLDQYVISPIIKDFDEKSFSISFQFSVSKLPDDHMPVWVAGTNYRWLGLHIDSKGNLILLSNNDGMDVIEEPYELNKFHEVLMTYENGILDVYFNNKRVFTKNVEFVTGSNYNFSTSNFGYGLGYKGYTKDLKIYYGIPETSADPLIADYPLFKDFNDVTAKNEPMTSTGATFSNGGILTNGDNSNMQIQTPLLPLNGNTFTIYAEFNVYKANLYNNPVFVMGPGWRWLGLTFTPEENNRVYILMNNDEYSKTDFYLDELTWYSTRFIYSNGNLKVYINEEIIYEESNLLFDTGNDFILTLSNLSNGSVFYGYFKNLKIYNAEVYPTIITPVFDPSVIAYFPLTKNAKDTTGIQSELIINAQDAINYGQCFQGEYGKEELLLKEIQDFDINAFEVSAEFKVDKLSPFENPLLVMGAYWRWMGVILAPNQTISMLFNNSSIEESKAKYSIGTWNRMRMVYNNGTGEVYLNDVLACRRQFQIEQNSDINLSVTNYSNASTYSGCIRNIIIKYPTKSMMDVQITSVDAACGKSDGQAVATVTGGNAPYKFSWTNGSETNTASDLKPGIYYLTVYDAEGVSNTSSVTISEIGAPVVDIIKITGNNCFEDRTGAIEIAVTGGVTPYTFAWSNGSSAQNVFGLARGFYTLTVTDSSKCSVFKEFAVTAPNPVEVDFYVNNASCNSNNGSINTLAKGGFEPYKYNWSNGAITSNITALQAGKYELQITDDNNCKKQYSAIVQNSAAPVIVIDSLKNGSCGNSGGAVYTTVTGGTQPYNYTWSNGVKNGDIIGVAAGTYVLTLVDGGGCKTIASATVLQAKPLTTPNICIVTIDPDSERNMVVWERNMGQGIKEYKVLREKLFLAASYDTIATVPFNSLSVCVDTSSRPSERQYLYKLIAVDSCGNVSNASPYHKTMMLQWNGNEVTRLVQFRWDRYEIEGQLLPFLTYYLYRGSSRTNLIAIDSISASLSGLNKRDNSVDAKDNAYYYRLGVKFAGDKLCSPGILKIKEGPYSSSVSNLEDNRLKSSVDLTKSKLQHDIQVYPTISDAEVKVYFYSESNQQITIDIIDVSGRKVSVREYSIIQGLNEIPISKNQENLSNGLYLIKISNVNDRAVYRIMFE